MTRPKCRDKYGISVIRHTLAHVYSKRIFLPFANFNNQFEGRANEEKNDDESGYCILAIVRSRSILTEQVERVEDRDTVLPVHTFIPTTA